jgi:hypothetical protein
VITDIITISFILILALCHHPEHISHVIQASVTGSPVYITTAGIVTLFWDASFFFVNKDAFCGVDGFEESSFVCTLKIFVNACNYLISSYVTLFPPISTFF